MGLTDTGSRPVLAGRELRDAIRDVVQRHLDLAQYELVIFGSEASGSADRRSDIDVGILGSGPAPGQMLQLIREELDTLRTLRAFDLVDGQRVDESFKQHALAHAERL